MSFVQTVLKSNELIAKQKRTKMQQVRTVEFGNRSLGLSGSVCGSVRERTKPASSHWLAVAYNFHLRSQISNRYIRYKFCNLCFWQQFYDDIIHLNLNGTFI